MDIKIQLITLIFSFFYGIFFSIYLGINYKYIYSNKKIFKIIITFLVVITSVLLYFIILRKINNGILHPYHILALIIGFIFQNLIKEKLVKIIKKWYNRIIRR